MANIKISELPTASKFNDDDYTVIVQNNTTKKVAKENMNLSYKYSTSETIVGTWIDDKPIYRKVINTNNLSGSPDYKSIAHNITNLDKVVSLKCIANDGSNLYFDFNNFYVNSYQVRVFVDNTNVTIFNGGQISYVNDAYIILEYTKTTD